MVIICSNKYYFLYIGLTVLVVTSIILAFIFIRTNPNTGKYVCKMGGPQSDKRGCYIDNDYGTLSKQACGLICTSWDCPKKDGICTSSLSGLYINYDECMSDKLCTTIRWKKIPISIV